jgi:hypothetical protein
MLKVANSVINASQITGVLPVVNGGTGVTTSTGTGNTVLSAAPTLSGDVTLSTGNLIPGTAAKGVNFTANTPASGTGVTSTSQLLNYYEEGTWTPEDASGAAISFATATGYYTRVGQVVTGSFRVTYSSGSVSAAQAAIGGLPFTAKNIDTNNCFVGCYTNATTAVSGETSANTTSIYFYAMGTFTSALNTNFSGKTVRGTFTYIA